MAFLKLTMTIKVAIAEQESFLFSLAKQNCFI
jgi:hypothetical protein